MENIPEKLGWYEQKLGGREAKCIFRDSEENNLVGAKFIGQNNTWMLEREVGEQATGH